MSDQPFSNREITAMFEELKQGNDRIEAQTTRTNGRVTRLEQWRWFTVGAVSVLTTLVVPVLAWAMYTLSNIDSIVHESVDEALSIYEIP